MRYSVRGVWKLSGEIATLRVPAETEEEARRYADAVGVIALDIAPECGVSPEMGMGRSDREEAIA